MERVWSCPKGLYVSIWWERIIKKNSLCFFFYLFFQWTLVLVMMCVLKQRWSVLDFLNCLILTPCISLYNDMIVLENPNVLFNSVFIASCCPVNPAGLWCLSIKWRVQHLLWTLWYSLWIYFFSLDFISWYEMILSAAYGRGDLNFLLCTGCKIKV